LQAALSDAIPPLYCNDDIDLTYSKLITELTSRSPSDRPLIIDVAKMLQKLLDSQKEQQNKIISVSNISTSSIDNTTDPKYILTSFPSKKTNSQDSTDKQQQRQSSLSQSEVSTYLMAPSTQIKMKEKELENILLSKQRNNQIISDASLVPESNFNKQGFEQDHHIIIPAVSVEDTDHSL
jgi:hypothetical protein